VIESPNIIKMYASGWSSCLFAIFAFGVRVDAILVGAETTDNFVPFQLSLHKVEGLAGDRDPDSERPAHIADDGHYKQEIDKNPDKKEIPGYQTAL
jgi:hypothetical protein